MIFKLKFITYVVHFLNHVWLTFTHCMSATNSGGYCIITKPGALSTPSLFLPPASIYLSTRVLLLPVSNRAIASLPRASLGCCSRGRGQPSGDPVSKAGGGNREGGWGGWWEVQQLQNSDTHTAAPCKHAGGRNPFVAARVVLLDGVEAGAAIVTSYCV